MLGDDPVALPLAASPELHWLPDPLVLGPIAVLVVVYARRFRSARAEVARESARAGGRASAHPAEEQERTRRAGDPKRAHDPGDPEPARDPGDPEPARGAGDPKPAPRGAGDPKRARGAGAPQALAFAAGVLALLLALASPLDRLGEDYLFSAHMLQHVLLGDVAPVLLLLSLSRVILRPVTRRLTRLERRLGPLASPWTGIAAWLVLMYLWHVPALYEAAIESPVVHLIEHASFFGAGVAVWWPLVQPVPMRRRLRGLAAVAYIGTAKFGLAALGLYLTWSGNLLYDHYADLPRVWGLSAIGDQNAGGAIMMVEQSLTFVIALVVLFAGMLAQSERDELRRERLEERVPATATSEPPGAA